MSALDSLTAEQRDWVTQDEKLWRRAHEIAARNAGVDVGGIYRVLRNLRKSPTERLKAALDYGRLFHVHPR